MNQFFKNNSIIFTRADKEKNHTCLRMKALDKNVYIEKIMKCFRILKHIVNRDPTRKMTNTLKDMLIKWKYLEIFRLCYFINY